MVRVRIGVSFLGLYQSLQFNVDGEPRGNLGPVGIGGVLQNNEGDVLLLFCKYVGVCD